MDPEERLPIQSIREREYELLILWIEEPDDPGDVNVDIEVRTAHGSYCATVFTLRNVVGLLDKWRATGEAPKSYFRVTDAIIVDEPITETLIRNVVAEAVATGDLEGFVRLDEKESR